jgi:hypothetical protein
MMSRGRWTRPLLHQQEPLPDADLVVDFTGVRRAVADMIVEAELRPGVTLVTITGGEATAIGERGEWRAPKQDLAAVVQVLSQAERLRIAQELALGHTFALAVSAVAQHRTFLPTSEPLMW